VTGGLVLLAAGAASDEIEDPFVHFWPPKVPSNKFDGFVLTYMPCYPGVMLGFQDLLHHPFRYAEQVPLVQEPTLDSIVSSLTFWSFGARSSSSASFFLC